MTTRGSLARGQGTQVFQGRVRKWVKQWTKSGTKEGNKLELLRWIATGSLKASSKAYLQSSHPQLCFAPNTPLFTCNL